MHRFMGFLHNKLMYLHRFLPSALTYSLRLVLGGSEGVQTRDWGRLHAPSPWPRLLRWAPGLVQVPAAPVRTASHSPGDSLPVICPNLSTNKSHSRKPLQPRQRLATLQHGTGEGHDDGQPQPRQHSHDSIALHPETFHLGHKHRACTSCHRMQVQVFRVGWSLGWEAHSLRADRDMQSFFFVVVLFLSFLLHTNHPSKFPDTTSLFPQL